MRVPSVAPLRWLAAAALALLCGLSAADTVTLAGSRVPVPAVEAARRGPCVADAAFMRRNHMEMLKHQRDDTLRGGVRQGSYSLKQCIACHASQANQSVAASSANFCQSCHAYAAVRIDCFECHANQPQAKL